MLSISIEDAIRCQWALAESARRNIRDYLRCRRRRATQGSAAMFLRAARDMGQSRNAIRKVFLATLNQPNEPHHHTPPP